MRLIKNYQALATTSLRKDALAIIEAGLQAIDTGMVLRELLEVRNGVLQVGAYSYILADYKKIYIVGFGKVSCTAARTLEDILSGQVSAGAVVGIKEQVCEIVDTYAGTHPLPSLVNYTATKHIEEIAQQATANDLVLVVVSGGGSALLCASMSEYNQGVKLFNAFLTSGGTIEELNIVRKHISHLKGGGLAAVLHPATVVGLIFSDVPGGDLSAVASGPTYLDTSTIADAERIIEKYQLGTYTLNETPKDAKIFKKVQNVPVVTNTRALEAMRSVAETRGYEGTIVSSSHYATPEQTLDVITTNTKPKTAYILGGETTLTLPADPQGTGGRNDYLALTALPYLADHQLFASVATDGHDNSDAAGALVDVETMRSARTHNQKPTDYVSRFNSYPFFTAVGGHLVTEQLESNVSDIILLLNGEPTVRSVDSSPVTISAVTAKVIRDSRGKPTVLVTVTAGSYSGTFGVPSGASTGAREAVALPAKTAVQMIRTVVAPAIIGMPVTDQVAVDALLKKIDGTDNYSVIGGNTALGVSVAALKAAAAATQQEPWQYIAELFTEAPQARAPRLFVNLINGGAHATQGSDIQEHQIVPETENVHEAFRTASAVQRTLSDLLKQQYNKKDISIGDEGGFVIPSTTLAQPFRFLHTAIQQTETSCPVSLGSDIAASSFVSDAGYTLDNESISRAELTIRLQQLLSKFPNLRYVEDPASEDDIDGFARFLAAHPDGLTIGDDLTTTNADALIAAVNAQAVNGIIIKPNQIGTVSDTLTTMRIAYQRGVQCIVSHRSGETMDTFIADLAFGTKCFGFKAGAPTAKERLVKYQRLLTISSAL